MKKFMKKAVALAMTAALALGAILAFGKTEKVMADGSTENVVVASGVSAAGWNPITVDLASGGTPVSTATIRITGTVSNHTGWGDQTGFTIKKTSPWDDGVLLYTSDVFPDDADTDFNLTFDFASHFQSATTIYIVPNNPSLSNVTVTVSEVEPDLREELTASFPQEKIEATLAEANWEASGFAAQANIDLDFDEIEEGTTTYAQLKAAYKGFNMTDIFYLNNDSEIEPANIYFSLYAKGSNGEWYSAGIGALNAVTTGRMSIDAMSSTFSNNTVITSLGFQLNINGTNIPNLSGMSAGDSITVNDLSITLASTSGTIGVGRTTTVAVAADSKTEAASFASANTSIATVSDAGVVTGVAEGITTITVTNAYGKTATYTVTVSTKKVVEFAASNVALKVGDTYDANDNVTSDADDVDGTSWTSSDANVASITTDGRIEAVAAGTTTITVSSVDNVESTFAVTVRDKEEVVFAEENIDLEVEKTYDAYDNVSSDADSVDASTWSSSDPDVATIDTEGTITAVAVGTATITVLSVDSVESTFTVTVKGAEEVVEIDDNTFKKNLNTTLDSQDDDKKMLQINIADFVKEGNRIESIVLDCTAPFAAAGWAGGGGSVGFSLQDDGWVQLDFAPASDSADNFTVTLDFTSVTDKDINLIDLEGVIQIGWWWGAGDTLTVNSITVKTGEVEADEDTEDSDSDTGSMLMIWLGAAVFATAGATVLVALKKREEM